MQPGLKLGNCVHRLISPDLHLSVSGTETISSNERSIDMFRTHFNSNGGTSMCHYS